MKRSHLVWLSGVVAIIGAFLVYEVAAPSRAGSPASASAASAAPAAPAVSTADLARLNAQLAGLRSQIAALEKQREAADGEPGAKAAAPAARALTDDEQRAEDERRRAEYMGGVEGDFQRQAVDPTWSSKTTERVRNAVAEVDVVRGAVRDVECRSNMCRLALVDDGSGALSKHLLLFAQKFADTLPRMAARSAERPGGGYDMELYLMGPDSAAPSSPKN